MAHPHPWDVDLFPGRRDGVLVTQAGRFLHLVRPQIAVVALTVAGVAWATLALWALDTGHTATGVVTNALWCLNNCIAMSGIIRAALWQPNPSTPEEP